MTDIQPAERIATMTCADAQSLRSHLRDCSRDRHDVACPAGGTIGMCPYETWLREGDEAYYDETRGPAAPCACCQSCRASCQEDARR